MALSRKVDICVVGAGSGGLTVAAGASQMGASVVLVEKHKMGGDCLNYGCVPSKALLAAAHAAETYRQGAVFGLGPNLPEVSFPAVQAHVQGVIEAIRPQDSVERFEALGVGVLAGEGRFLDARRLAVGDQVIEARRFVIATGSVPFVPPIPGLDSVPYLTNETIFENSEPPRHLIVMGGGPIGLEMAQAHRRLGAEVSVVEMAKMLPKDDPELVGVVRQRLAAEGVRILEGAKIVKVAGVADGVAVEAEAADGEIRIEGSHLLVAVGRRAQVAGLDLAAAGIEATPGGIVVDARLRTTNRRVFAIGDVAGGLQFTHVAGYHAGVVLKNALFRLPAKADLRAAPWVTYTDPELAQVGLAEDAARVRAGEIRILRWPFAENDRAQTERRTDGLVKAVTDRRGRILGAGIAGPHAGELIQPWILAIANGMKIGKLATMIAPYPTLGEASKRAAGSYYTPGLFSERTRKLVRFLARFG
ncbi:MAG: FAD-dependent oxidoreductase [Alphaproteobacteria bacterium]|jgi:pyruvate/2-oxoglutarate dehydrogenase complex dihydrolipoamide dehydrogenase (E3) component|nr:FAD-dependent oxidoreductase [Alphaproteobacteria bacterium]